MEELNFIEIGARIRAGREELGLTREQLAEQLEVSAKFCSDIELGLRGISVKTLNKLVFALNVSSDEILYGKGDGEFSEKVCALAKKCPEEKQKYLGEIIKSFIKSTQM